MEEIGLSREEYEILTDSAAVPLWRMYGFPAAAPADADVIIADPLERQAVHPPRRHHVRGPGRHPPDPLRQPQQRPDSEAGTPRRPVRHAAGAQDGTIARRCRSMPCCQGAAAPDPGRVRRRHQGVGEEHGQFRPHHGIDHARRSDRRGRRVQLRHAGVSLRQADGRCRTTPPRGSGAVEFVRLLRFIRLWKKTGLDRSSRPTRRSARCIGRTWRP